MSISQNSIGTQQSGIIPLIQDQTELQIPTLIQISKSLNSLCLKTSDKRAELIRSNKDIMKRHLKNSLKTKALMISINSKDEKLTASSLKDLDSDSNLPSTRLSSKKSFSSFGSDSVFSPLSSQIVEQSWEEKYDFIKKIGQGAHSTVYKSLCKVDNKIYAVKKIKNANSENCKKMKTFYRMVKLINHENIVKYHDFHFDEEKKTAFIVMDYCEFSDLRSQIQKRQINGTKFHQKEVLSIAKKVSSVLKYLHSEGICHRDMKPENILYDQESGELKIIDLDVCGVKRSKNQKFDLWTNTGTLLYRAPESFQIGYSEKADIWGLGTILYELLTGKVPFESQYEKDFLKKVRQEKVNFELVKCGSKIKHILERSLEKNSSQRISAVQLLDLCENKIKTDDFYRKIENFCKTQQQKSFDDSDLDSFCLGSLLRHTFQ